MSSFDERNTVKSSISEDGVVTDIQEDDTQMPGRIYLGDITSDGYPDILITIKYTNGTTRPHVLVNEACDIATCTQKAEKAKRRKFSIEYNQYQILLNQFEDVKYAAFFDLNENSMMDILLVKGSLNEITAIYNNFGRDAFFLKTRMISDDTIGNTAMDASFRCVLTDLED